MVSIVGRTVRVYLADGSPTGLLTVEIPNWTGHVLVAPRSRLGEVLKRQELNRTGVYLLIGEDPKKPSKELVYIGESDCIGERLKSHANDESKEFWQRVCIVTSKDHPNLLKTHVAYLENRLIEMAKSAAKANLANANDGVKRALPESDIADMESFLEQVSLILPIVGIHFLRPQPQAISTPTANLQPASNDPVNYPVELTLHSKKYGHEACAIESDGEFTVLAGSQATTETDFAQNSYSASREELIMDGRLRPIPGRPLLEFTENVAFPAQARQPRSSTTTIQTTSRVASEIRANPKRVARFPA